MSYVKDEYEYLNRILESLYEYEIMQAELEGRRYNPAYKDFDEYKKLVKERDGLDHIDIAYTTKTDAEIPVQVSVDLIHACLNVWIDDVLVRHEEYGCLENLYNLVFECYYNDNEYGDFKYFDAENFFDDLLLSEDDDWLIYCQEKKDEKILDILIAEEIIDENNLKDEIFDAPTMQKIKAQMVLMVGFVYGGLVEEGRVQNKKSFSILVKKAEYWAEIYALDAVYGKTKELPEDFVRRMLDEEDMIKKEPVKSQVTSKPCKRTDQRKM